MATRKSQPGMPTGVGNQKIDKLGAYGIRRSAQISETKDEVSDLEEPDSGLKKPTQTEQTVPRSPARSIVRQWATPSYDPATGRAWRVQDDTYTNTTNNQGKTRHDRPISWEQIPDAGVNTTSDTNNRKGRGRPGRW